MNTENITPAKHRQQVQVLKLLTATAVLVSLAAVIYTALQLEPLPLPKSETASLTATQPYLFDIVLVDGASLDSRDIDALVQPMRMVLQRRMPGKQYHARVAVFGSGLPLSIDAGNAAAGFLASEDMFFVDMRHLYPSHRAPGVTTAQWWGFIMGHETMHLIQKLRGTLTDRAGSRGAAYAQDPLERQAYREGLTVANSLGAVQMAWTFSGEDPLYGEPVQTYLPFVDSRQSRIQIRTTLATTYLGKLRGIWYKLAA